MSHEIKGAVLSDLRFDTDHSGSMSWREVQLGFRQLGQYLSKDSRGRVNLYWGPYLLVAIWGILKGSWGVLDEPRVLVFVRLGECNHVFVNSQISVYTNTNQNPLFCRLRHAHIWQLPKTTMNHMKKRSPSSKNIPQKSFVAGPLWLLGSAKSGHPREATRPRIEVGAVGGAGSQSTPRPEQNPE